MNGSIQRIPNFIKARSPQRLRVLMLETQARTGFEYDWKIVFNSVDKNWYGWFSEQIDFNLMTGEIDG